MRTKPQTSVWSVAIAAVLAVHAVHPTLAQVPTAGSGERLTIVPPTAGAYLGQHASGPSDDLATFEQSVGKKVALWSPYQVMTGQEPGEGVLSFDVRAAERAWAEGYPVFVGAYEATPLHRPFTVDKLLRGEYDRELGKLAQQFRQFGKPLFFSTAREPNAVLASHMGGFGPDGERSMSWATANGRGLEDFLPSKFPNPALYEGLGDAAVCDGIERLVAAQRYYFDFFVRREGLNFLTFDTMAWAAHINPVPADPESVMGRCARFEDFYRGLEGYADWVTITWYPSVDDDLREPATSFFVNRLNTVMQMVRRVAPNKPVMIMELGFCGNLSLRAERIDATMDSIVRDHPDIRAVALWGSNPWGGPLTDCLIKPGSREAAAFKEIMELHPGYFRSCVRFSDGSTMPNCQEDHPPRSLRR